MEQETRTMLRRQFDSVLFLSDLIWVKVQANFQPPPESEMPSVLQVLGAIITRVLFGIHAGFILWVLLQLYSEVSVYWLLYTGPCLLVMEAIFTVIVRKGHEYRYFWPSSFFYLCSVVPCVWILHLNMLGRRISHTNSPTIIIAGLCLDEDFTKNVCELGLVLNIIAGRWILPRGPITRDQLSALLLEYVAIAADILELFEAFEADQVQRNYRLTVLILSIYTWSLFQFTFSFTAFVGEDEEEEKEDLVKDKPEKVVRNELKPAASRKYLRKLVSKQEKEKAKIKKKNAYRVNGRSPSRVSLRDKSNEAIHNRQLHGDLFGILAAIFMQDGPFLLLRLYLIIALDVNGDLQIFFAGKNAVTLALLIYRLLSVQCLKKADEQTPFQRFRTASIAVLSINILRSQVMDNNNFNGKKEMIETKNETSISLPIK